MKLEHEQCAAISGASDCLAQSREHEIPEVAGKGEIGESFATLLSVALDQLGEAIFIARHDCKLIHANRPAKDYLEKKTPFAISKGCLVAARDSSWDSWTDWVRRASDTLMVEILAQPDESRLIVTGSPIDHVSGQSMVMIRCREVSDCAKASATASAALYGLTRREQKVLESLLRGLCPKRIALQDHVSISTIRSQIKAVLSKSQHKTVQSLVALTGKIP